LDRTELQHCDAHGDLLLGRASTRSAASRLQPAKIASRLVSALGSFPFIIPQSKSVKGRDFSKPCFFSIRLAAACPHRHRLVDDDQTKELILRKEYDKEGIELVIRTEELGV
jgi:hypothetical protein